MSPEELRKMLRELIQEEFEVINHEIQRAMGDDDLVSTGTVGRLLGICSKKVKILIDRGELSVYDHLKERRYNRGEILDYRNKHKTNRKRG